MDAKQIKRQAKISIKDLKNNLYRLMKIAKNEYLEKQ